MASMTNAISVVFFPEAEEEACTNLNPYSRAVSFHPERAFLVQSPYIRLITASP